MKSIVRLVTLGFLFLASQVFSLPSQAQDSLRYENMSCVSSTNPDDIQEGLTFTIKVSAKKKTKFVETIIEGYPGESEAMDFIFGRTADLGIGTVIWRKDGSFMLSRNAKGTQWFLYFGAIQEGKVSVPCQIIKKTSFGNDMLMYQLVFTSGQIEQIKTFLNQALKDNILKQMEL